MFVIAAGGSVTDLIVGVCGLVDRAVEIVVCWRVEKVGIFVVLGLTVDSRVSDLIVGLCEILDKANETVELDLVEELSVILVGRVSWTLETASVTAEVVGLMIVVWLPVESSVIDLTVGVC